VYFEVPETKGELVTGCERPFFAVYFEVRVFVDFLTSYCERPFFAVTFEDKLSLAVRGNQIYLYICNKIFSIYKTFLFLVGAKKIKPGFAGVTPGLKVRRSSPWGQGGLVEFLFLWIVIRVCGYRSCGFYQFCRGVEFASQLLGSLPEAEAAVEILSRASPKPSGVSGQGQ
jgi:hypothetical protein